MSFKTNDDDDDQDEATTTLSHDGTTMFQFATTTMEHGSALTEHVQHQPSENVIDEFPNHSNSESLQKIREEQPQEEDHQSAPPDVHADVHADWKM